MILKIAIVAGAAVVGIVAVGIAGLAFWSFIIHATTPP